jgi:hypothetical protein
LSLQTATRNQTRYPQPRNQQPRDAKPVPKLAREGKSGSFFNKFLEVAGPEDGVVFGAARISAGAAGDAAEA